MGFPIPIGNPFPWSSLVRTSPQMRNVGGIYIYVMDKHETLDH